MATLQGGENAGEQEGQSENFAFPNIRHLRVLDSVARNTSIGKAATEFGLSQPAVSQAIAKIEQSVGRPLLDRTRGGSYLTPAGDVFLHRAKRFLDQIDSAVREIEAPNTDALGRHISSTQIRALLAIAFSTSFSEAARFLGISAPALHRVARELEAMTGIPLYQSSKLGVTLNAVGAEFARKLGLAAREITAAGDDLTYLDGVVAGGIMIGVLPMSGSYLIGATIAELTAMLPKASVSITNSPYNVLMDSLRTGKIDLIFGALRQPHPRYELHEEELFSDPYCIVGRADHPLASCRDISTKDLLEYDWIVPAYGSARRKQYETLFENVTQRPRTGIETSSMSTIRSILLSTDRLALVNKYEVDAENRLAIIQLISDGSKKPAMPKGITTRLDWLPTPAQKRFLEMLRKNAQTLAQG